MPIVVNWRSQIGTRTEDNRDCAGVAAREDDVLCIVADGSTKGLDSGELAREITRELIDWYVGSSTAVTAESLIAKLKGLHEVLPEAYPQGSVSYMILYIRSGNDALVVHAGDCLLGRDDGQGSPEWLTRPHTLANAGNDKTVEEIVDLPARHRLTRSFRAKEFMRPEVTEIAAADEFIVATDGFWAGLSPSDQCRFMAGHDIPMTADGDDRSIIRVRRAKGAGKIDVQCGQDASGNLYIR
jgi:serine/threonine protein phosphatase PrpC